jgi:hypothetical protein
MKAKVMTKEDLNKSGCGLPNCTHDHSKLFLHSSCHIEAPTWVIYEKAIETLIVKCADCGNEVIRIKL